MGTGWVWSGAGGRGGVEFLGAEFEMDGRPGGDWGYWERGNAQ